MSNAIPALVILALAISIGVLIATSITTAELSESQVDESDINSIHNAIEATDMKYLQEVSDIYTYISTSVSTSNQYANDRIDQKIGQYDAILNAKIDEKLSDLQAQITELQAAKETLSENQITLPEKEIPPQKVDFGLRITDNKGVPQESYGTGDVLFISGSADVTTQQAVEITFWDEQGNAVHEKENVGIPINGRFLITFEIPQSAIDGVYSMTITDGKQVDSITFLVE